MFTKHETIFYFNKKIEHVSHNYMPFPCKKNPIFFMVGPNVNSISIKGCLKVVSKAWNKKKLYQKIEYITHNYMSFPYRKNNPKFFIVGPNVDGCKHDKMSHGHFLGDYSFLNILEIFQ